MKKTNYYSFIILFTGMSIFLGCSTSDDSDDAPVEIRDESILTGDVNAPDFWDDNNLVWNDEFDGDKLSSEKWVPQQYSSGDGNEELQRYTKGDNLEVSNGTLKINAFKTGEGQKMGDYTSGRLHSKFVFTYGRVEMRAKLPADKGDGLWLKLWLLGSNFQSVGFPTCGTIDMMNYVSHLPHQFTSGALTAANISNNSDQGVSKPIVAETAESEFHTYGVLWTDKYLKFYIDDVKNITFTYLRPENSDQNAWPFDKSFYFVMNIAVGGKLVGASGVDDAIFPTAMEIDYVRLYHGKK